MVNANVEIASPSASDWEAEVPRVASGSGVSASLKRALSEALEQDPASAVKDAAIIYQIMLGRALAQPSIEWKWRSQPTWCWVCNSHNTRLVGVPGYGIVHECLECGDQFLLDGAIHWGD